MEMLQSDGKKSYRPKLFKDDKSLSDVEKSIHKLINQMVKKEPTDRIKPQRLKYEVLEMYCK